MAKMSNEETLQRFVLRARRVQAHSIVQDREELLRYSGGSVLGELDLTGRATFRRKLPPNEEVFESLVSRVRPLTVKSEPIHYAKVFDAIQDLVGEETIDDELRSRIRDLRHTWDIAEIQGTNRRLYSIQSVGFDAGEPTNIVSDTQLASAWLYADLVHADAKGPKQEALAFPLRERYAAAVQLFSHIAALTVETLRIVESLKDARLLDLNEAVWEEDVIVGATELVQEAKVFTAPVGSEMPDLRDSLELPGEWSRFTVMELLRRDPYRQVRVVLRADSGDIVGTYDAAVARRRPDLTPVEWDLLIEDSVLFKFAFNIQDGGMVAARSPEYQVLDSTNELKLKSARFLLSFHRASTMTLKVAGIDFISMEMPSIPKEETRGLEVFIEALYDIVRIEEITKQTLQPCNEQFNDEHRVRLRFTRLLLEGEIVHAPYGSITVTSPEGNPPRVVMSSPGTLNIGGTEIASPAFLMRHPAMTVTEIGPVPSQGPKAKAYRISPPDGEQFFAWVHGLADVANDEDLAATKSYELIGIEEQAC